MPVNSHIQIPNFVLRNFRITKTGKVTYLDLQKRRLRSCSSDVLGTEYGYYSDDVEKYLCSEVEHPFSMVVTSILKFLSGQEEKVELPITIKEDFIKYLSASMSRSNFAFDIYKKNSIFSQFIPGMVSHNNLVALSAQSKDPPSKRFSVYTMIVIVNKTKLPFVVPRNCFYSVMSNGCQCIVAPISPICAFALLPPDYGGEHNVNGEIACLYLTEDVEMMNNIALEYEYIFNKCFIVSTSKDELFRLEEYLISNEERLEKMRMEIRT